MERMLQQGRAPAFLYRLKRSPYRIVWTLLLAMGILLMIAAGVAVSYISLAATESGAAGVPHVTQQEPQVKGASTTVETANTEHPVQSTPVAAAAQPAPAIQAASCQRAGGFSGSPAVSARSEGVSVQHDAPYYYTIAGSNASDLIAMMRTCGPSGEFAGQASYRLVWSYAFGANEQGLCVARSVKVAVRTNVILPSWQPALGTSASLIAKWQRFSSGLAVHEQGHAALSEQYARQLYSQITQYPPTPCENISVGAEAMAQGVAAQLTQAQAAYDVQTNHGVSQGAIF